jgi:coronin-7
VFDDGYVRVWKIPESGLSAPTNEPACKFPAHAEKIQIVKFHPFAKDIILTSAFDRSVKVWDISDNEDAKFDLQGHTEQAFSLDWSQNGKYIASVCKDGRIRIYEPLGPTADQPKIEGGDIVVKKGARILWVLDDQYLVITGFNKTSERQVMVYRASDLKEVHTVPLDVSPTILIPYYDQDSNTLFVTGKGESTVVTFEVSTDAPHLFALSPYKPSGLHQGFSFLPKNVCDVRQVEFARAFRLLNTTFEPITFTVPRVKTAYFQDDLFPPTKILWEATISSREWLSGSNKQPKCISLQPGGMKCLSATRAQQDIPQTPSYRSAELPSSNIFSAKQVTADPTNSVSSIIAVSNKLEQDNTGVDRC